MRRSMKVSRSMRRILLLAGVLLLIASCEHADPLESGGLEPTLASIQSEIFDRSCALSGCHAGPNPQLGLDLTAGNARQSLVGVSSVEVPSVQRVDPGNPDDSYLIIKLEGNDSRMVGGRMPLNQAPLDGNELATIREWIVGGAE